MIDRIQVPHDTKLLLSVVYPYTVSAISVRAVAPWWCHANTWTSCETVFQHVGSVAAVRASLGNTYHVSGGIVTFRIVQPPPSDTGRPSWSVPIDPEAPFVRSGLRIPRYSWNTQVGSAAALEPSTSWSIPAATPRGHRSALAQRSPLSAPSTHVPCSYALRPRALPPRPTATFAPVRCLL
jgi:hypothetical protein